MVWKVREGEAYALLTQMAAETWGMEPLPELARETHGKPFFPAYPQRRFNLSHTGGLAMCALSDREVGCDVELVHARREGLPRYVLSGGEYAWFRDRGARWEDFYTLWTMKEARVKCTGQGLTVPVREIAVPLLEPGQEGELEGFSFWALAGEGWRGAVCEKRENMEDIFNKR